MKLKYRRCEAVASWPPLKNGSPPSSVDGAVGEGEEHSGQQVEGEHAHDGLYADLPAHAQVAHDADGDGGRAECHQRRVHRQRGALADAADVARTTLRASTSRRAPRPL